MLHNSNSHFLFASRVTHTPPLPQIFIKAFPRTADGRQGLLENTGLVEMGDCLTAINGNPLPVATPLHEVMANIRAAKSPLTLRFARYPAAGRIGTPLPPSSSLEDQEKFAPRHGESKSADRGGAYLGDGNGHLDASSGGGGGEGAKGDIMAEDPELDAVMNSPLLLGLGERVAGIQKNNTLLLQTVERIATAAVTKRAGVEAVASAAVDLTATAGTLPRTLKALAAARVNATALCETMARLDESLAARERAVASRRKANDKDRAGK